jgi:hypothetical protein
MLVGIVSNYRPAVFFFFIEILDNPELYYN